MTRMQLSMMLWGAITLTGAIAAQAAPTNAQKCEAAKLKAAGKYHFCRIKADRKVVLNGGGPDYSGCDTTLTTKWTAAETSFGGACPTFGDVGARLSEATTDAGEMALRLSGATVPSCGDGTKNGSEQCDGVDLGGASCTSVGYPGGALACSFICQFNVAGCTGALSRAFPVTGQTTCWNSAGTVISCAGTGHDGEVQAGAPLAYVDNGDGTITDLNTGLMWEKLSDDGSIHDWDNQYTWDEAFAVKVATLNSGTFAGHTDWRVPNRRELESIVSIEAFSPSVSAVFNTACVPTCTVTACSCTPAFGHWSSSTYAPIAYYAWGVYFYGGDSSPADKTSFSYRMRAVRGGL